MVYVYMVTCIYLVKRKANLQVNYVSDQHNTGNSSATGFGPADYFFVSAGTYGPSKKVTLWYILSSLSFNTFEFHTCKGIYSDTLCCYALV